MLVIKTFDKINHWLLFKKNDRQVNAIIFSKILCYWYRNQLMYVRWGSTLSNAFQVIFTISSLTIRILCVCFSGLLSTKVVLYPKFLFVIPNVNFRMKSSIWML